MRNHRSNMARRPGAFTLVELVIVILIMGIFAAVAMPKFVDSLQYHTLQSAARHVKADLERLRSMARLTSKTQMLVFNDESYEASDDSSLTNLDDPTALDYVVHLADAPYEIDDLTISFDEPDVWINPNETEISFDPYGIPNAPAKLRLIAGAADNDHTCIVRVDPLGNIEIITDEE